MGTVSRTSDTAGTVKFTSDEAGNYYYAVVADGGAEPTIDTSGAGTAGSATYANAAAVIAALPTSATLRRLIDRNIR